MIRGCSSYRTGIVAGESSLLVTARRERFDGTSPGVVFCHGSTWNALMPLSLGNGLIHRLAEHGFIVVSSDWGGDLYGNASMLSKMAEARTWLLANGAKAGAIGLFGISAGFMGASAFAVANPSQVGAVVGLVPSVHGDNLYADNASVQAGMDAAWGGDYAANGTSPHDTLTQAIGAMTLLAYSSADTVIRPADVTSVATAIGAEVTDVEPTTPSGHSSYGATDLDWQPIVRHFDRVH